MTFQTLNEIKQHQYTGKYSRDCTALASIEEFVHDANNSVGDRAEAIRDMNDRGLGFDRHDHMSDEQIVQSFVAGSVG